MSNSSAPIDSDEMKVFIRTCTGGEEWMDPCLWGEILTHHPDIKTRGFQVAINKEKSPTT